MSAPKLTLSRVALALYAVMLLAVFFRPQFYLNLAALFGRIQMHCKRTRRLFGSPQRRIALVVILVLAVGMLNRPVLAQGTASGIDFQILDSATGFAVPWATVKWGAIGQTSVSPLSQSAVSSPEGKVPLELSPGDYGFEISAPGFKPMRIHYPVTRGSVVPMNVNLDPVVPPEELRKSTVASELQRGMELVHGFVTDAPTHRPIAQVKVELKQSGATATTNSRGYFQLTAPAQDTSKLMSPKEFPPPDTLTASAPGYKTYIHTGLWHNPHNWAVINIELTPGTGSTREDTTPVPLMPRSQYQKEVQAAPRTKPSPIPRFLLRWLSGRAAPAQSTEQQLNQAAGHR